MGAETRTEVQISLNYPNGSAHCCCVARAHTLCTAGALALPTFRGSPHEKISMRFTYQHLLFLLSLSLYQNKLTVFYLSMVDAQIRITLTSEGGFSFPWSCHLNLKAYHFPHQATVMFLHPCFTSFLCAGKLCVTQENERKSFLFSLHSWLESSVISYVVNNAFSFSCTLKFVLKQFRKLVEVESYSNLKSLGLQLQSHLFFHSLSCIFFPLLLLLFYFILWSWISCIDFRLRIHFPSCCDEDKVGWLTPILGVFSKCRLEWASSSANCCLSVSSIYI